MLVSSMGSYGFYPGPQSFLRGWKGCQNGTMGTALLEVGPAEALGLLPGPGNALD